jgi:hypothetical protein
VKQKIKRGDWVRFMQAGRLFIGEVFYIQERVALCPLLVTDAGNVSASEVLETRSPEAPHE